MSLGIRDGVLGHEPATTAGNTFLKPAFQPGIDHKNLSIIIASILILVAEPSLPSDRAARHLRSSPSRVLFVKHLVPGIIEECYDDRATR